MDIPIHWPGKHRGGSGRLRIHAAQLSRL